MSHDRLLLCGAQLVSIRALFFLLIADSVTVLLVP